MLRNPRRNKDPTNNKDDEDETPKSSCWSERLVRELMRRWQQDATLRRGVGAGCALTLLALLAYRKRQILQNILKTVVRRRRRPAYANATEAPLSLLYKAAREGQIPRALLGATGVFFFYESKWRRATLPHSDLQQRDFLQILSQTCPDVSALPESLASRLATPALAALPFVYLALVYRMMNNLHNNNNNMGGKVITTTTSSNSSSSSHHNKTSFADVAGMDQVLVEVAEVVEYLQHQQQQQQQQRNHLLGARAPRAILLYGPPGTGKTLLAQAVAGQAGVDAFGACSASAFVEMYVGRGAARVRQLFADLRRQAIRRSRYQTKKGWWMMGYKSEQNQQQRPATAILFIDELDALAKTRSQFSSNDEREQTLNQLLTEMDGFDRDNNDDEHSNVTLVVMAATNRVDVLDPAILRRFERQVHVGYPNDQGRQAILQVHARRIECCNDTMNWEALAREELTGEFSGADIRNMVNEAALLAVREGCQKVEQEHMEHAARRIREMKQHHQSDRKIRFPIAFE